MLTDSSGVEMACVGGLENFRFLKMLVDFGIFSLLMYWPV